MIRPLTALRDRLVAKRCPDGSPEAVFTVNSMTAKLTNQQVFVGGIFDFRGHVPRGVFLQGAIVQV